MDIHVYLNLRENNLDWDANTLCVYIFIVVKWGTIEINSRGNVRTIRNTLVLLPTICEEYLQYLKIWKYLL